MSTDLKQIFDVFTKEQIEKASSKLHTKLNANYLVLRTDGTFSEGHGACHMGTSLHEAGTSMGVLTKVDKDIMKRDRQWYEWLANDSPWAEGVLIKDPDWIVEYGVLGDGMNVPCNVTQSINILSRHPKEQGKLTVSLWKALVNDYGWDGVDALILIHGMLCVEILKPKKGVRFRQWWGHSVLSGWTTSPRTIKNLRNREVEFTVPTFHECGIWMHVETMFASKDQIKTVKKTKRNYEVTDDKSISDHSLSDKRGREITDLLEKWEEEQKTSVVERKPNPRVSVFGDVSKYLTYRERASSALSLESVGMNREGIMSILTNENL